MEAAADVVEVRELAATVTVVLAVAVGAGVNADAVVEVVVDGSSSDVVDAVAT